MLTGKRVLLGISGSIAAYKAADLARALIGQHGEVSVVMTENACRFISPLTFRTLTGRPVATQFFAEASEPLAHITLAQWPQLIVIAPASADLLARAAHGRAEDLLSAILLDTAAPILWAPAMNCRMWNHPLTQANVQKLAALGQRFIGPVEGELACGQRGQGRLAALETIMQAVTQCLLSSTSLVNKKVLITAGPTREAWDAIRFLSNRSTGKMGYALAGEASRRGAEVFLVSGPVALAAPVGVKRISVTSAQEMYEESLKIFPQADIVIAAAAVADFRPAKPQAEKLKKAQMPNTLELVPNPDILKTLGERKTRQILVGFAAETSQLAEAGIAKRRAKNCDFVIVNAAGDADDAFGAEKVKALLIDDSDQVEDLTRQSKPQLAARILDQIEKILRQKFPA